MNTMRIKWVTMFVLVVASVRAQETPDPAGVLLGSLEAQAAAYGGVAAVTDNRFTYQGHVSNAAGPIDNQSLYIEFSAWTAAVGGVQRGATVPRTLAASEMRGGAFTVDDIDADELGLPEDDEETYLQIALCADAPCPAVAMTSRTALRRAPMARSATQLRASARALDSSALQVSGPGPEGGVMLAQRDVGAGVMQEMRLDAGQGMMSLQRDDDAAAALRMRSSRTGTYTEWEVDDLNGEAMLRRWNAVATAAPSTRTLRFRPAAGEIEARDDTGTAQLRAVSRAVNGGTTYMLLDDAAKEITFGGEYAASSAAGVTPPPSVKLSFADGVASMAARNGPNAAALRFVTGATTAMELAADGKANFLGPEATFTRLKVLGTTTAANTAGPTPLFASLEYVPPAAAANTAGTPDAAELQLKVGDDIVARWTAPGDSGFGLSPNFITGSASNSIAPGAYGSIVAGGTATLPNTATGFMAIIAGGGGNVAGPWGTVGGGAYNSASENSTIVAGGESNSATARHSTVSGGLSNTASGQFSVVGGGELNTASGAWSTVPGGNRNRAGGADSFAAGFHAVVRDPTESGNAFGDHGTFVWADKNDDYFTSDGINRFLVRASGGTAIYSSADLTAGVTLAAGGGSWSSVSDKNLKENFAEIDKTALLEKLSTIPVTTWNYKSQDDSIRHIGPMGQDFHAAFGVGETDTRLSTIDADGVALAAIQGLHELVQEKDCEMEQLRSEISDLNELVKALAAQSGGGR